MNRRLSLVGSFALALAAVPAAAETGLYGGLGVGGAKIEADVETPIQFLDGSNNPIGGPVTVDFDEYDASFKAFAGYRFLDWLAVEGGWYYLGEPDGTAASPDPSSRLATQIELKGWNVDLVGFWRFNEQWEAFAKLGVFIWEDDLQSNVRTVTSGSPSGPTNITANPSFYETDESGEDIKGGVGLQYLHDDNLALRGEFEYFDVDDTDAVWLLSFSALWRFN